MDTYPRSTSEQWEQHGHLRGVHGFSSYKTGKLKNADKALPLPDKSACTVEARRTRTRTEWYVYTPNYWFYITDKDVFERRIDFK
jgi:hypothetical protein